MKARRTIEALALVLGKTGLETSRWQKIYNSNFGNIKAGPNYVGMFTCFPCNEVFDEKVHWYVPEGEVAYRGGPLLGPPIAVPDGHPQTRFRAYANAWDGALEYARFLKAGRYAKALSAMLSGDAARYVHELKIAGYFTADEASYLKGVRSLQNEFLAKLKGLPHEEVPIDDGLVEEVERLQMLWFDTVLHDEPGLAVA